MRVEAVALNDFMHDDIRGVKDRIIQPLIERSIAEDLERAGLCRIKMPKLEPAKHVADTSGKTLDDGQGRPSSALQLAQASPAAELERPTLKRSDAGKKLRQRRGG